MSEQINRYQPTVSRQGMPLSANTLLGLVGLVMLTLCSYMGYGVWKLDSLENSLTELQQQTIKHEQQRDAIRTQLSARTADTRLVEQVRTLEIVLANRLPLLNFLEHEVFKIEGGYSDYFRAFARQYINGMWLTGIKILGAGESLVLEGKSVDPELVPKFLQKLSNESVLVGIEFQHFKLQRAYDEEQEKLASAIDFSVATVGQKDWLLQ